MVTVDEIVAKIGSKLLWTILKIVLGIVIGAWLFSGCNKKNAVINAVTGDKTPKATIEYVTEYLPGEPIIDTIYLPGKPIIVNNPIPTHTNTAPNELPINTYVESIEDESIKGVLTMETKGTLTFWEFVHETKQVQITRVDTFKTEIKEVVLQPKRNILLLGAGADVSSTPNLQSIHVGAGLKMKSDKLLTYNYNLGVGDLPPYHSVSFYFPIKPREWIEKKRN